MGVAEPVVVLEAATRPLHLPTRVVAFPVAIAIQGRVEATIALGGRLATTFVGRLVTT